MTRRSLLKLLALAAAGAATGVPKLQAAETIALLPGGIHPAYLNAPYLETFLVDMQVYSRQLWQERFLAEYTALSTP